MWNLKSQNKQNKMKTDSQKQRPEGRGTGVRGRRYMIKVKEDIVSNIVISFQGDRGFLELVG